MGEQQPSVWGLTPVQLHDRFWAARGVQVVRRGHPSEIVAGAELFLLTDSLSLAVFNLAPLVEKLCWDRPDLLYVRLHDTRDRGYREQAIVDAHGRFVRLQRTYGGGDSRLGRVCLTGDASTARAWQSAPDAKAGWGLLRRLVPRRYREAVRVSGGVYDRSSEDEVAEFARHLVKSWKRPDSTIRRVARRSGEVWVDLDAVVDPGARFIGPVWVGAGRRVSDGTSVVGPSILWDEPSARPAVDTLQWDEIEPMTAPYVPRPVRPRATTSFGRAVKRAFDIAFALIALAGTVPIYPAVMLAIWLEDGRPFFFGHRRETCGGREFACLKFRSMRKNAEQVKRQLAQANQSDGPQFFMENDPRLTRVGRVLRATNLDELPQFINVLLGHMSVVGPRPSPRAENQFCPPWREARLSVRPGITGLWQVKRTRQPGLDFQEWIKYDIEYVERADLRLDALIIWQTVCAILFRGIRS